MKRIIVKRIVFPLVSITFLTVAVMPIAQAVPSLNHRGGLHPTILNPAHTAPTDVESSTQAQPRSALEQARLNRLDQAANASRSLDQQQAIPANDLDPHNLASVSPLQQMRLNQLNSNHRAY